MLVFNARSQHQEPVWSGGVVTKYWHLTASITWNRKELELSLSSIRCKELTQENTPAIRAARGLQLSSQCRVGPLYLRVSFSCTSGVTSFLLSCITPTLVFAVVLTAFKCSSFDSNPTCETFWRTFTYSNTFAVEHSTHLIICSRQTSQELTIFLHFVFTVTNLHMSWYIYDALIRTWTTFISLSSTCPLQTNM